MKDEGDLLIELGEKGQEKSFDKYVFLVQQMGQAKSSKALQQEVRMLKGLQSSWEEYDDKVIDGNKLIEKSSKLDIKAIKANDEASRMMEKLEKNKIKLKSLNEQKLQLTQVTAVDLD